MNNCKNIKEVINLSDLKEIVYKNNDIIIGFVLENSLNEEKIMIRKFLKSKSKIFQLNMFVYMQISDDNLLNNKLCIIDKDKKSYPIIICIKNKKEVLTVIRRVNEKSIEDDFKLVEKYYYEENKKQMEYDNLIAQEKSNSLKQDKKINSKKLNNINKCYKKKKIEFLEEINKRKKIEQRDKI